MGTVKAGVKGSASYAGTVKLRRSCNMGIVRLRKVVVALCGALPYQGSRRNCFVSVLWLQLVKMPFLWNEMQYIFSHDPLKHLGRNAAL